jgi:ubiquinone/menaquinone biosynthesis C-methylase UbiE
MSIRLILARLLYWWKALFKDPVELFNRIGVESTDHVLEIGCAIGYHTTALAQIASKGKVFAVDPWKEAVTFLGRRLRDQQNVHLICMDAELLELPISSLDKVVCFDTLHEVQDCGNALERWTAFLRKGGKFYYTDPVVSPQEIERLSNGNLHKLETINGIHIFSRD